MFLKDLSGCHEKRWEEGGRKQTQHEAVAEMQVRETWDPGKGGAKWSDAGYEIIFKFQYFLKM